MQLSNEVWGLNLWDFTALAREEETCWRGSFSVLFCCFRLSHSKDRWCPPDPDGRCWQKAPVSLQDLLVWCWYSLLWIAGEHALVNPSPLSGCLRCWMKFQRVTSVRGGSGLACGSEPQRQQDSATTWPSAEGTAGMSQHSPGSKGELRELSSWKKSNKIHLIFFLLLEDLMAVWNFNIFVKPVQLGFKTNLHS